MMIIPPSAAERPVGPDTANPANALMEAGQERQRRVPMSQASRTLEVDPLPGYHLHWFREGRVLRAKAAGYELCTPDEACLNNHSIGASTGLGGNTDLGSSVSVVGSVEGGPNGPERLVLMKIKEEWWQEDSAALAERNLHVMRDIFGGERIGAAEAGASAPLPDHAYVKTDRVSLDKGAARTGAQKPIINRGMPKARTGGRFNI